MRVWEFEDNRAIPSDLVREQDFILRLRRLQRLGTSHLVINLVLTALQGVIQSRKNLESLQQQLLEFSKITNGYLAEMSNGDVFIVWEETVDANLLASRLFELLSGDKKIALERDKTIIVYHIPKDYGSLRERANFYVEVVRTASQSTTTTPADALKGISTRGPLTAWGVDQIGKLFGDIDLRSYGRTQPVYLHKDANNWQPIFEEYYISFEDLRRERFPKLDIVTPEHLFLALCEILDQRLLETIIDQPNTLSGRRLNMNLSVASVMGTLFAQFARALPAEQHKNIGFEIHRGDLFQNLSQTISAIEILKNEGFKIALDSVTPDMLSFVDFSLFDVDFIKINVSKDRAEQLLNPEISRNLARLSPEKIVFFRCDSEKSMKIGAENGIKFYQGWLIDDLVSKNTL